MSEKRRVRAAPRMATRLGAEGNEAEERVMEPQRRRCPDDVARDGPEMLGPQEEGDRPFPAVEDVRPRPEMGDLGGQLERLQLPKRGTDRRRRPAVPKEDGTLGVVEAGDLEIHGATRLFRHLTTERGRRQRTVILLPES